MNEEYYCSWTPYGHIGLGCSCFWPFSMVKMTSNQGGCKVNKLTMRSSSKFLDMNCLAINYHLVMKTLIYFNLRIWLSLYRTLHFKKIKIHVVKKWQWQWFYRPIEYYLWMIKHASDFIILIRRKQSKLAHCDVRCSDLELAISLIDYLPKSDFFIMLTVHCAYWQYYMYIQNFTVWKAIRSGEFFVLIN